MTGRAAEGQRADSAGTVTARERSVLALYRLGPTAGKRPAANTPDDGKCSPLRLSGG